MIEFNAIIETGNRLHCWTKNIQNLSKLNENITFEIKIDGIVLSGINSSMSVYQSASFGSSFFRGYNYKRFDNLPEEEEEQIEQENEENDNATTFELQAKFLAPIFKKVEKDEIKINQLRLKLLDNSDKDEKRFKDDDKLGLASSLEFQVVGVNKILKTYRISCMNAHQSVMAVRLPPEDVPYILQCDCKMLKKNMDYMSQKCEEFSFTVEPGALSVQSRTPKITTAEGEVLKRAMSSDIAIPYGHIDCIKAIIGHRLAFKNKEFRNFILTGESLPGCRLEARFKEPEFPVSFQLIGVPGIPPDVEIKAIFQTDGRLIDFAEKSGNIVTVDNTEGRLASVYTGDLQDHMVTQYATPSQSQEVPVQEQEPQSDQLFFYDEEYTNGSGEQEQNDEDTNMNWNENHESDHQAQDEFDFDDDFDEEELNRELEQRSQSILGPTQNQSQAKGLFD